MSPLVQILILLFIIGFAAWWLLIDTEGVYLGRRVVIWLYDLYASRYDNIKQYNEVEEHLYLAQPILNHLSPHTDPMVLDVATGTGRIPLALCQHARFEGHIVALDLSRKMLEQATQKLLQEHFTDYVTVVWANGADLPFTGNSFDVVSCMEALEFMPNPEKVVSELVRPLRPGGLLLTTRRINTYMPGRLWEQSEMCALLQAEGITNITFQTWHTDYELVWAQKAGESKYIGAQPPENLIQCPNCQQRAYQIKDDNWCCKNCGKAALMSKDGILDMIHLR